MALDPDGYSLACIAPHTVSVGLGIWSRLQIALFPLQNLLINQLMYRFVTSLRLNIEDINMQLAFRVMKIYL